MSHELPDSRPAPDRAVGPLLTPFSRFTGGERRLGTEPRPLRRGGCVPGETSNPNGILPAFTARSTELH